LMGAAGFHQHRGAWRGNKKGRPMTSDTETKTMSDSGKRALVAGVQAAIRDVVDARKTSEWLDSLEDHDRKAPGSNMVVAARRVCRADPANSVLEKLLDRTWSSEVAKELIRRQFAEIKADLEGPTPSVIERHLAELASLAWLDAHGAKMRSLNAEECGLFTIIEKSLLDKVADRAHRRYVTCLKTLSMIRNKAIPALRLQVAVKGEGGSMAAASIEYHEQPIGDSE
jgi:hypothetical protein